MQDGGSNDVIDTQEIWFQKIVLFTTNVKNRTDQYIRLRYRTVRYIAITLQYRTVRYITDRYRTVRYRVALYAYPETITFGKLSAL